MAAYETDEGAGGAGKLGLIVLSTDETLEFEARALLEGRGLGLLHARIPAEADVTPEALQMMEGRMEATAALLPKGTGVIGYACTSASTVIGPPRVAELVQRAHPEAQVSNPISAVVAALQALGVKRLTYVSPYVPTVTAPMRAYLGAHGIKTVAERSFGESDDYTVARITERSTETLVEEASAEAQSDAVFISCTNLRSFGIIDALEAKLGKPVVSSNQALLWHMLQLSGQQTRGWGPGQLFRRALPA